MRRPTAGSSASKCSIPRLHGGKPLNRPWWGWPRRPTARALGGGARRRRLQLRGRTLPRIHGGRPAQLPRSSAWPPTPEAGGYWEVASDGGIFASGALLPRLHGGQAAAIADHRHGRRLAGWQLLGGGVRRRVFRFGGAGFTGSMGSEHLNTPIVGLAATAEGGVLGGGVRRRDLQLGDAGKWDQCRVCHRWDLPGSAVRGLTRHGGGPVLRLHRPGGRRLHPRTDIRRSCGLRLPPDHAL